jgi:hypothetical protein
MIQKTFPAFGFFIVRNDVDAGEVISDGDLVNGVFTADQNFACTWVYSKGLIRNTEVTTGEQRLRPAGYNNIESAEPVGTWRAEVIEPTVIFCIPPIAQNNVQPPLIKRLGYFHLPAGASTTLPNATKLSLCDGKLLVGGMEIRGMRQVQVKSRDVSVTAVEDCYGILFP